MHQIKINRLIVIFLCTVLPILALSSCNYLSDILEEESQGQLPVVSTGGNEIIVEDKKLWYDEADDYSIVTMYLTVMEGNSGDNTDHTWEEVNSYSVFYYEDLGIDRYAVEGILQVGDENGPVQGMFGFDATAPNAVVNVRGNTTSTAQQKSYKIEIDKGKGYWREQRSIILNKHIWDPVRFRNKLTYDLIRDIPGMISARTQFVHLYVKDLTSSNTTNGEFQDYGLFTQVEQFNSRYLRNHGLDENGSLYKAEMFEFYRYEDDLKLADDPDYNLDAFEDRLEVKGNTDHSKLLKMLDDVNNPLLPIEDVFSKYFDEENYFSWMALNILIGNVDTASRNFFLYSPLNSEKWYFISWDNDGAWSIERLSDNIESMGYEIGVTTYWNSVLHQRVLKIPEYRQKLDEKIHELKAFLSKEMLTERILQYSQITMPYIYRMPDLAHAYVTKEVADLTLELMPDVIEANYKLYLESLKRPTPFYLGLPQFVGENRIRFNWDNSYDFDGEKITYKFQISDSFLFDNIIYEEQSLLLPEIELNITLPDGQYFYRVIATNESGYSQAAFDYYVDRNYIKNYGILSFFINGDDIILDS